MENDKPWMGIINEEKNNPNKNYEFTVRPNADEISSSGGASKFGLPPFTDLAKLPYKQ